MIAPPYSHEMFLNKSHGKLGEGEKSQVVVNNRPQRQCVPKLERIHKTSEPFCGMESCQNELAVAVEMQ